MKNKYEPDYLVCPGETLKELLKYFNWTSFEISIATKINIKTIYGILNGSDSITKEIAYKLSLIFPETKQSFWINLEKNYQEDKRRLNK